MNSVRRLSRLVGAGLFVLLAGCRVGPDYQRPAASVPGTYKELSPVPPHWKAATPADDTDRGTWWSIYHDPGLDRLESEVDIKNQNLKQYEAAYRQALAVVAEARSGLFPRVMAGGTAGEGRFIGTNVTETTGAAARASWDLDVWGKVRRQVESDSAAAQAGAAELASIRLSAQAGLATDYFELRYEDSLAKLLRDTVAAYQRILDITHSQYAAGSAALSDVVMAETQLQTAQAQLVAVSASRAQYEHAIALLTGQTPTELTIPVAELVSAVPEIPVTMPSTLLERRPDVAQAERLMQRENALIGVAQSAYYPDISLSGLIGYAGAGGVFPLSSPVWSLTASGSELLLDGGGRSAAVAAARAVYDQSVASYRQTVLAAFHDVEDALSDLRILAAESEAQAAAVASSQRAVELALREYQAGAQTYTTVANAQVSALAAKEAQLQIQENRLRASVALLQALGGGWRADL